MYVYVGVHEYAHKHVIHMLHGHIRITKFIPVSTYIRTENHALNQHLLFQVSF